MALDYGPYVEKEFEPEPLRCPDDLAWISLILPFTCVERLREVPRDSMHWPTGKPSVLYKQEEHFLPD